MTIRTVYIGSEGPFKYDDQLDIDDPDGLFSGVKQGCIVTDGSLTANVVNTISIDISGTQLEQINAFSYFIGVMNG